MKTWPLAVLLTSTTFFANICFADNAKGITVAGKIPTEEKAFVDAINKFNKTEIIAQLGKPALPPGKVKQDEFFGKSVIYRNRTVVRLPVAAPAGATLTLTADLQGCADIGVCYPPVRRTFTLTSTASPVR